MNEKSQSFFPFGLKKNEFFAILFLIIIYAVGIIGIGVLKNEALISWTPLNLLISLILMISFHTGSQRKLAQVLLVCFSSGLLIEILGVQTGIIFGGYQYGPELGPKLLDTPIIIGINWAMLIYAIGSTINLFFSRWNFWIKTIYGAVSMVVLDYFIEPVAIQLNFWSWTSGIVPIQNYLAWGIISFFLFLLFFSSFKTESNKVAYALFILQFVFFGTLNLLLNL